MSRQEAIEIINNIYVADNENQDLKEAYTIALEALSFDIDAAIDQIQTNAKRYIQKHRATNGKYQYKNVKAISVDKVIEILKGVNK